MRENFFSLEEPRATGLTALGNFIVRRFSLVSLANAPCANVSRVLDFRVYTARSDKGSGRQQSNAAMYITLAPGAARMCAMRITLIGRSRSVT